MELTVKITEQEAQLILTGLGELQAKVSTEFILKFKNICEKQIKEYQEKGVELAKEEVVNP